MNNRFRRGTGCFKCEECGKLTRQTDNNTPYCRKCYEKMEKENEERENEVI